MASISVSEIQQYVDNLKDWTSLGESPAKECLVIRFRKSQIDVVIDEEMANRTLYFQSANGSVTIEFAATGQIVSIEVV